MFLKLCSTTNTSCQLWQPGAHATGMVVHILSTCSKRFSQKAQVLLQKKLQCICLCFLQFWRWLLQWLGHNCALPLAYSGFRWNALRYFKDGGHKKYIKIFLQSKGPLGCSQHQLLLTEENRTCLEAERSFQKSAKTPESVQAHLQPYYIMWTGIFRKMIVSYQMDNSVCLLERNIWHLTSMCNVIKLLAI